MSIRQVLLAGGKASFIIRVIVTLMVLGAVASVLLNVDWITLIIVTLLAGVAVLFALDARSRAGKASKSIAGIDSTFSQVKKMVTMAVQTQPNSLEPRVYAAIRDTKPTVDDSTDSASSIMAMFQESNNYLTSRLVTKDYLELALQKYESEMIRQVSLMLVETNELLAAKLATKSYIDSVISNVQKPLKEEIHRIITQIQSSMMTRANVDESLSYFRDAIVSSLVDLVTDTQNDVGDGLQVSVSQ